MIVLLDSISYVCIVLIVMFHMCFRFSSSSPSASRPLSVACSLRSPARFARSAGCASLVCRKAGGLPVTGGGDCFLAFPAGKQSLGGMGPRVHYARFAAWLSMRKRGRTHDVLHGGQAETFLFCSCLPFVVRPENIVHGLVTACLGGWMGGREEYGLTERSRAYSGFVR